MKPGYEFSLMKGRAIGAFTGFVDVFNWMFKFLFHLKSSKGTIAITDTGDDHYSIDIAGASSADEGTSPVKTSDGVEWKKAVAEVDNSTICNSNDKLALKNADSASSNTVPVMSGGSLTWKPYNEGEEVQLEFRGTDGTTATGSVVRFAAADDTAITTNVTKSNGVVIVKIGLHWNM